MLEWTPKSTTQFTRHRYTVDDVIDDVSMTYNTAVTGLFMGFGAGRDEVPIVYEPVFPNMKFRFPNAQSLTH